MLALLCKLSSYECSLRAYDYQTCRMRIRIQAFARLGPGLSYPHRYTTLDGKTPGLKRCPLCDLESAGAEVPAFRESTVEST